MRKLLWLLITLLLLSATASADVLGVPTEPGATQIDLTSLKEIKNNQTQALIADLQAIEGLQSVNLRGVYTTDKQKAALVEALPGVDFQWVVTLNGVEIDSAWTTLDLDSLVKSSTKLSAIRQALSCLPNVDTVIMYKFINSQSNMERLLADYPDIHFEWSIHWKICDGRLVDLRTDATCFSTLKGRQDPRYTADMLMQRLKYCPNLLGIDAGHNNVSDLNFLTNWPNLKYLIIIDSKKPVTDLSPLAELMDLEYVELFMQNITDLSPLANHTKLKDLNVCHNNITDLSPLYSCTALERLHISYNPGLTAEEVVKLQEVLPNCVIETETYQSTGAGWREHERYFVIQKSFETYTYIPFAE